MQRLASFLPPACANFFPKTGKTVGIIGGGAAGMLAAERLHYRRILEDALGVEFMQGYVESLVDRAGEATGSTPASNAEPAGAPENGGPSSSSSAGSFSSASASSSASKQLRPSGLRCLVGKSTTTATVTGSSESTETRNFDYIIVATGVQNGIWKQPFASLEERMDQVRRLSQAWACQKEMHVVGAGIVGTEMAAEIAHYLRIPVSLYDGNPRVLFQLPKDAADYAKKWLDTNNCALRMGEGFDFENHGGDPNVIKCVGAKPTAKFLSKKYLDSTGYVKVNRQLQVLEEYPTATGEKGTAQEDASAAAASQENANGAKSDEHYMVELAPAPGLFACGDCVSLEGMPKTMFVAEEMAALVVSNIERLEGFDSDLVSETIRNTSLAKTSEEQLPLKSISEELIFPFCVSLGPADGVFAQTSLQSGGVLLDGRAAAMQKQLIEDTKMMQLREESFYAKLAWSAVH
ncbi:unnamed protein product [Amoebophrya sp. A25]|nr:unnamed protein product [Amoebophrya sp. A25]|eukprot:GSA25T00010779001.1